MGLGSCNRWGQAYSYFIYLKLIFPFSFSALKVHMSSLLKCSLIFPGRIPHPFISTPLSSPTRYHIRVVRPSESTAITQLTFTEGPLHARRCSKCVSFQTQTTNFTDKGAEAQRIKFTHAKAYSWEVGGQALNRGNGLQPSHSVPVARQAVGSSAHKAEQ